MSLLQLPFHLRTYIIGLGWIYLTPGISCSTSDEDDSDDEQEPSEKSNKLKGIESFIAVIKDWIGHYNDDPTRKKFLYYTGLTFHNIESAFACFPSLLNYMPRYVPYHIIIQSGEEQNKMSHNATQQHRQKFLQVLNQSGLKDNNDGRSRWTWAFIRSPAESEAEEWKTRVTPILLEITKSLNRFKIFFGAPKGCDALQTKLEKMIDALLFLYRHHNELQISSITMQSGLLLRYGDSIGNMFNGLDLKELENFAKQYCTTWDQMVTMNIGQEEAVTFMLKLFGCHRMYGLKLIQPTHYYFTEQSQHWMRNVMPYLFPKVRCFEMSRSEYMECIPLMTGLLDRVNFYVSKLIMDENQWDNMELYEKHLQHVPKDLQLGVIMLRGPEDPSIEEMCIQYKDFLQKLMRITQRTSMPIYDNYNQLVLTIRDGSLDKKITHSIQKRQLQLDASNHLDRKNRSQSYLLKSIRTRYDIKVTKNGKVVIRKKRSKSKCKQVAAK